MFLDDGEEVPEVTTVVHGIIQGVEMPFPLKNPDACLDSGLACPIQKDINYAYMQTLQVLKIYPKVSARLTRPQLVNYYFDRTLIRSNKILCVHYFFCFSRSPLWLNGS